LETPQYLTIRARRKDVWTFAGFNMTGRTFDFVLCRKDGAYSDGRRPDEVAAGTILDDLARRDFTMNAIAIDADGLIIDPHNGTADIGEKVIRCVGGVERLYEDGLRMMRALRFRVQLDFTFDDAIRYELNGSHNIKYLRSVSADRIRDELEKALRIDTMETLGLLLDFLWIGTFIFEETGIWLKPTSKQK
jgi:tRNA nucleotidyltransferase/poly(A) polymerase